MNESTTTAQHLEKFYIRFLNININNINVFLLFQNKSNMALMRCVRLPLSQLLQSCSACVHQSSSPYNA